MKNKWLFRYWLTWFDLGGFILTLLVGSGMWLYYEINDFLLWLLVPLVAVAYLLVEILVNVLVFRAWKKKMFVEPYDDGEEA